MTAPLTGTTCEAVSPGAACHGLDPDTRAGLAPPPRVLLTLGVWELPVADLQGERVAPEWEASLPLLSREGFPIF